MNLICCWALHSGSTSGREIRGFFLHGVLDDDVTKLSFHFFSPSVKLPSHQCCRLPPLVSNRTDAASDVRHGMVLQYMSYTMKRRMHYLYFSFFIQYMSPNIKQIRFYYSIQSGEDIRTPCFLFYFSLVEVGRKFHLLLSSEALPTFLR